jgi:hypothetical protein
MKLKLFTIEFNFLFSFFSKLFDISGSLLFCSLFILFSSQAVKINKVSKIIKLLKKEVTNFFEVKLFLFKNLI